MLKLTDFNKEKVWEIPNTDAKVWYKNITWETAQRLQRQGFQDGVIKSEIVSVLILETGITRWENIVDCNEKELPDKTSLIQALPEQYIATLQTLITNDVEWLDQLKNSTSTLSEA